MKTPNYWLLKTEPETFSFEQLLKDGHTNWNGVRNYQARNYLRQIKEGDVALIYHSGDSRAVVGTARITREAYADLDPQKKGDWVQVDIAPLERLASEVSLNILKSTPSLKELPLLKQGRLSVMPITEAQYRSILALSKTAR